MITYPYSRYLLLAPKFSYIPQYFAVGHFKYIFADQTKLAKMTHEISLHFYMYMFMYMQQRTGPSLMTWAYGDLLITSLRKNWVTIREHCFNYSNWKCQQRHEVSNHRQLGSMFNIFAMRLTSKNTSKLHITALVALLHRSQVDCPHKWIAKSDSILRCHRGMKLSYNSHWWIMND